MATILRRIAMRVGRDNQLHVVRALEDEADYLYPKVEEKKPREWWIHAEMDIRSPFDCAYHSPDALNTKLVKVREVLE